MKRMLIVRGEARYDVMEQFVYLAERSPATANRFWNAAEATFRKLVTSPLG